MSPKREKLVAIFVMLAIGISAIAFCWFMYTETPMCLECNSMSYSTKYCDDCGEWMNPPYCTECDKSYFSEHRPQKFCRDCGTKLVTLKEDGSYESTD